MNFTAPLYLYFFLFLLSFLFVFSLLKINKKIKNNLFIGFILIFSYLFYASWSGKFLLLIIFTTFFDYNLAILMNNNQTVNRKSILFFSFCSNLGILFFFKYSPFFGLEISRFLLGLNISTDWKFLQEIVLPAGISFYTFQSMGYMYDVYRGKLLPERNFFRYALFLAFFPQLVAGPIVLAEKFLPQLDFLHSWEIQDLDIRRIFGYLFLGFLKKAILADRLAPIVEVTFGNPSLFSSYSLWIGALAYSLQIYGDFSGYTDIARGSALIFRIELPENFNMPYLASSFSNFWRRWHITLSSWLREFLYIPLGGNRKGEFRTYINLIITMLLGGLWHGANWTFLLWGLLHGLLLAFEKIGLKLLLFFFPVLPTGGKLQKWLFLVGKLLYRIPILLAILLLWILFRSPDLATASLIIQKMFSSNAGLSIGYTNENTFYFLLIGTILFHLIGWMFANQNWAEETKPVRLYEIVLAAIAVFLLVLLSRETRPFIYFVF